MRWMEAEAGQVRPETVPSFLLFYVYTYSPGPFPSLFPSSFFFFIYSGLGRHFLVGWEEGEPHFDGRTSWAYPGETLGRGQEGVRS